MTFCSEFFDQRPAILLAVHAALSGMQHLSLNLINMLSSIKERRDTRFPRVSELIATATELRSLNFSIGYTTYRYSKGVATLPGVDDRKALSQLPITPDHWPKLKSLKVSNLKLTE